MNTIDEQCSTIAGSRAELFVNDHLSAICHIYHLISPNRLIRIQQNRDKCAVQTQIINHHATGTIGRSICRRTSALRANRNKRSRN